MKQTKDENHSGGWWLNCYMRTAGSPEAYCDNGDAIKTDTQMQHSHPPDDTPASPAFVPQPHICVNQSNLESSLCRLFWPDWKCRVAFGHKSLCQVFFPLSSITFQSFVRVFRVIYFVTNSLFVSARLAVQFVVSVKHIPESPELNTWTKSPCVTLHVQPTTEHEGSILTSIAPTSS